MTKPCEYKDRIQTLLAPNSSYCSESDAAYGQTSAQDTSNDSNKIEQQSADAQEQQRQRHLARLDQQMKQQQLQRNQHEEVEEHLKQLQAQSPQSLPQSITKGLMEQPSNCLDAAIQLNVNAHSATSMKVFSMIMLHAWRQRRSEVRQLQRSVENLKKDHLKSRNQLHVYSTLIRVEQRRNDELSLQLKKSLMSVNKARSSCDSLTTSVLNLTADKALLEQELNNRKKELEAHQTLMSQTKKDLFRALLDHRGLQMNLSQEQRLVRQLKRDNQRLNEELDKISTLDDDYKKSEEKYRRELEQKNEMLMEIRRTVHNLEDRLQHWQIKERELEQYRENEQRMHSELHMLRQQIDTLREHVKYTPKLLADLECTRHYKDHLPIAPKALTLHRLTQIVAESKKLPLMTLPAPDRYRSVHPSVDF